MRELPEPIKRLNRHSEIAELVHISTFGDHRALVDQGAGDAESAALLQASAAITFTESPRLLREVQEAAIRWQDQEVLDPSAAATTLQEISEALDGLDETLQQLRRQHAGLAAEMRRRLDRARER